MSIWLRKQSRFPQTTAGVVCGVVLFVSSTAGAEAPPFGLQTSLPWDITLFAREPDVLDPVALTFDERGICYVVEMRDYPLGIGPDHLPGGTIRRLEDRDHDGRVDHVTVFADGLRFPTSVVPWRDGILVTAPPDLLFFKDADGDGKAEVRKVLLTGFTVGVTDSNVNGLRWGFDNWLHGLNGGNGGNLRSPLRAGMEVDLRESDFRFDPVSGEVQRTFATSGGFGWAMDVWGHRFSTYNINHIQHQAFPVRYLERIRPFFPIELTGSISDHEEMSRIYPVSPAITRVNHPEQAGHFSAAGGMGFWPGTGQPEEAHGSMLVGDVVGNLVHRDLVVEEGPSFVAKRPPLEAHREFLASTDPAFRPVGWEAGPDDAFYLIDMQRDVIEHPDYIPEKVREKLDLRGGADRGRIYRLRPPAGAPPRSAPRTPQTEEEWVQRLEDPNGWWRSTAQRVLVERMAIATEGLVRAVLRRTVGNPARLHAVGVLEGWKRLRIEDIELLLKDPQPGIREMGLQLGERFDGNAEQKRGWVIAGLADPHARVRFQAALTASWLKLQDPAVMEGLANVWQRDLQWKWSRVAVLMAAGDSASKLLQPFLENIPQNPSLSYSDASYDLSRVVASRLPASQNQLLQRVIQRVSMDAFPSSCRMSVLRGLTAGFQERSKETGAPPAIAPESITSLLTDSNPAQSQAALELGRAIGLSLDGILPQVLERAGKAASDVSRPLSERCSYIRLLGMGGFEVSGSRLLALLSTAETRELQQAVIEVLGSDSAPAAARGILNSWRRLNPVLRPDLARLLTSRRPWHSVLLDAVENKQITVGELNLDLEQRRQLLRRSSPENQARARRFFSDEEYAHRRTVVEEWLPRIPKTGSVDRGRGVFVKICAGCHQAGSLGNSVGPNLTDQSHRSVEDLVSNILDPNMVVNPKFATVSCETLDGELISGVLETENSEMVVLRQAQGIRKIIQRSKLKSLEYTALSLMPEGLESVLSPQDLRDVVAFLQSPAP